MSPPKVHADHIVKERSLTRINAYDEILECSAHCKRPNVKDFIAKLKPGGTVFTTTYQYKSSCAMDLTWAVTWLSLDFLKSPSSCLFSTCRTKDFSYLIGANFSVPKMGRCALTNQRSPGYPLGTDLSNYAQLNVTCG